jgi:predicted secreted hydrolase
MRSRSLPLLVLLVANLAAAQYKMALPGYHYQFPRDHFNHPEFQTEWWYYTGNLRAPDGHRFGFELTFFRTGLTRNQPQDSTWAARDLYFAHLALSDLDGQHFYHAERSNRAGPGIAGADEKTETIWNGNWQVHLEGDRQDLQVLSDQFNLRLTMESKKPPVIHGENGVSQKAEEQGRASHYISLTRLLTAGVIEIENKAYQVTGTSWMDHEFFTHQLEPDQVGWDWLSLQFDDDTELMLFRIRRKDGSIDSFSAGTYIDPRGLTHHLRAADFTLKPSPDTWTSPNSSAVYPIRWQVSVPALGIAGEVRTALPKQEMTARSSLANSYWDGAIDLTGTRAGQRLSARGYLEMTGYDRPVQLGQ